MRLEIGRCAKCRVYYIRAHFKDVHYKPIHGLAGATCRHATCVGLINDVDRSTDVARTFDAAFALGGVAAILTLELVDVAEWKCRGC